MANRRSLISLLRQPTFRSIWSASLVSNLGALIQTVGAGWMMTSITDSRSMVALVQSSSTLPIMLFSLFAGALADNYDRRRIMLTAQSFMVVVSVMLSIMAYGGLLTPWLLLTFTFLIGCGTALYNPSWQSTIGDIVSREDLPSAVAMNSMGFNLMRSVGPALGGFIVATLGAAAAFLANAMSYIVLIVALARWKPDYGTRTLPRETMGRAVSAGVRYVSLSPHLVNVMARAFLFGGSAIATLALLPIVARSLLGGTALTYGVMLGAYGVGAIIGAFSNSRLRDHFSNEWIVRGAFIGMALAVSLLAASHSMWLSVPALMLAGASWVLALSLFNVTVQLSTPRWVLGRAIALYQTATFGGMASGSWLWGTIADAQGPRTALAAAGLVLVVGALVGFLRPLPAFGTIADLTPMGGRHTPAVRLDLTERSGPILVMIDYEIAQEDIPAFLAAMTDRRRIRRRNGGRQWVLLRDLEDPRIWTESYHVPTWVEYARHLERRTNADAEVTERLRALHCGEKPPRVHRMIERQTVPRHDDMPLSNYPEVH